ncbi:MAG: DUF1905 domain-containing protein [Patescibacteria group bacterium]
MSRNAFKLRSKVWLYPGMSGWHFISVPKKESEQIKEVFGALKRGWGSLPVEITLGKSTWRTSIFPDKKSGTYLLPLKADVRKKERILNGDSVNFLLEIKA